MDLSNLVGLTGVPSAVYYIGLILCTIFGSGWVMNNKIRQVVTENLEGSDTKMSELAKRVQQLENDAVKTSQHDKDLNTLTGLIHSMRDEMRENMQSITQRIDSLFPLLNGK